MKAKMNPMEQRIYYYLLSSGAYREWDKRVLAAQSIYRLMQIPSDVDEGRTDSVGAT